MRRGEACLSCHQPSLEAQPTSHEACLAACLVLPTPHEPCLALPTPHEPCQAALHVPRLPGLCILLSSMLLSVMRLSAMLF
jgi:hypothetical protein